MPQQIVVDVEQLIDGSVFSDRRCELLNRSIEIEQQLPLAVFAHHALDPEERREANSTSDWLDAMQARAGVERIMSPAGSFTRCAP
jgi:hypothetical protein